MFTIELQLLDHMSEQAVSGAQITNSHLAVEPRWQELVNTTPSYGEPISPTYEIVISSGEPVLINTKNVTQLNVNTFEITFDIDSCRQFFTNLVEELPQGPCHNEPPGWSKARIHPIGRLTFGVEVAGLNRRLPIFDRLKDTDTKWVVPFHIDFAQAIVGHTTSDSALLWFAWHGDTRPGRPCVCEIEPLDATEQRRSIDVAFDIFTRTTVASVPALRPASTYLYSLHLLEGDLPADGRRLLAAGEFTTAPDASSSDSLNFVFGSCHDPKTTLGPTILDHRPLERWEELAKRRDYDLISLLGDQIYGDDINELGRNWLDCYAKRYQEMWAYRPLRQVLQRTPTYMILDDHEVADDWGSVPISSNPHGGDRVSEALTAYRAFQHSHNPGIPNQTGPFHYHFRRGPVAFFVLDLRSRRRKSELHPILGDEQFRDFEVWARSEEVKQADVIVVVATIPIAFLPVEQYKQIMEKSARSEGRRQGWKIGYRKCGFLGGAVGWAVGHFEGPDEFKSQWRKALTAKDLQDLWSYGPNQTELTKVLGLLFDLAGDVVDGNSGNYPRAVLTIGGDVHMGAKHIIVSRVPKHGNNRCIYQLISSPISNDPAPKKDVEDVARKIPRQYPLDDKTKNFWVEEWSASELLLYRNFGRVAIKRARRDRRVYQFSLAIEGQMESRRLEMELDLDAQGPIEPRPIFSPVVHDAIRDKWVALGGQQGFLGAPLTDETAAPDGVGRFTHFEGGSIYWHPGFGAHEVHGLIKEKWAELGREGGFLGYPLTDETATPDGVGRFNHFHGGSIYWHPNTGAHEVHGDIRYKCADSDRIRPGFPRRSRPPFRNDAGHRSEMKPATQPRF